MGKLRFIFARLAAKALRLIMRALRRNATYLPGLIALKICSDYLFRIKTPPRIVLITGTNGKTTVSNLLSDTLELCGFRVLSNRLGSNVAAGIAACLTNGTNLFGRTRHDIAVLEMDERSAGRILPALKPELLVITNLFRDSIMRNAHPQYIADFLTKHIPRETKLILNADDLISSAVSPENKRVYFGIEPMEGDARACENLLCDMRVCPRCLGELRYEYRRYHHIGKAVCAECGYASPEYDFFARNVDIASMTMTAGDSTGTAEFKLPSGSVFNIYNVITVIATLRELGLQLPVIRDALDRAKLVESRFNSSRAGAVEVVMQMSKDKNALACSRAFDYVSGLPGDKELILMMNCLSDQQDWSENVSWMYDCDFEFLSRENITRIVAAGPRARDYYLRLLLAGAPEERLRIADKELDAPGELALTGGESVYIFYGADSIGLAFSVRDEVKRLAEVDR